MPYRRGRTSIPGREFVSAFFSDAPEFSPWTKEAGGQLSPRGHRAVRLALACGFAAAGLCLVLGMTALALAVGSSDQPGAPDDAIAARAVSSTSHATPSPHPPKVTATRAGRTIASLQGTTGTAHAQFGVSKPGTWGLSWSSRCPGGRPGHLVVRETTPGSDTTAEVDVSGRGTVWTFRDAGEHSLTVTSDCPWALQVVLPRAG